MIRQIGGKRFPDFEIRQTQRPPPRTAKTTVKLTPENASTLSWCSKLTGLPAEELINFFLAEYFENFNEDNQDNFCEETIGL